VCTIKKNIKALVVTNKNIGLEVNADTKYMFVYYEQNAGQN
jgi:hypothetical protein